MSTQPSIPLQAREPISDHAAEAPSSAWKQELNQRLAAHRNRRGSNDGQSGASHAEDKPVRPTSSRAAEAAARVAARYANAPSYNEMLVHEARTAMRAAEAATLAAKSAQAAAQALLAGLDAAPTRDIRPQNAAQPAVAQPSLPPSPPQDTPFAPQFQTLQAEAPQDPLHPLPALTSDGGQPGAPQTPWDDDAFSPKPRVVEPEAEFGFDRTPFPEAVIEPDQPIPANLIEFPRELVATRKARPRMAERGVQEEEVAQLSIFEVRPNPFHSDAMEPSRTPHFGPQDGESGLPETEFPLFANPAEPPDGSRSRTPHTPLDSPGSRSAAEAQAACAFGTAVAPPMPTAMALPEWSGIELDARPAEAYAPILTGAPAPASATLWTASLEDRLMALLVDASLIALAFLAAAVGVIATAGHLPTGRFAEIGAGAGLAAFALLYHLLFFTFADETPGMRYANLSLCTFDDSNPTRAQMRRRIPALLLAALPAGLGLLWAIFDEDHLGWHDRLTRTYLRKY